MNKFILFVGIFLSLFAEAGQPGRRVMTPWGPGVAKGPGGVQAHELVQLDDGRSISFHSSDIGEKTSCTYREKTGAPTFCQGDRVYYPREGNSGRVEEVYSYHFPQEGGSRQKAVIRYANGDYDIVQPSDIRH